MGKSQEIKSTDGRRNNKRKKSIPLKPIPEIERSNKPALNTAKKKRQKQYAKKAIKNVFGSEVGMFETMAKKAKDGSYNHMKLLAEYAYMEDESDKAPQIKAPQIVFINNSEQEKKLDDKTIDVDHKDVTDEDK